MGVGWAGGWMAGWMTWMGEEEARGWSGLRVEG